MKKWNSSPHPISDIRDWQASNRLEIRPDFQRKAVWSDAAKIMLMDTILREIPMPKIFVASVIKGQQVYRTVIDGQQRIGAILGFLKDEFSLDSPYNGEYKGKYFSQLPQPVQDSFFQYRIDFNEAIEFTDEELRETYSRLNKYSVALTKQELRRADFPGDFLKLSERLALNSFLDEGRIFSAANRRRSSDVEFVSELLAGLIAGPQDKRDALDSYYLKYSKWSEGERKDVESRFIGVMKDLRRIFSGDFEIHSTRFRQKADFYSLVLAIDALRRKGGSLDGVDHKPLVNDLRALDHLIAPESESRDCRDYAIKCVSQANSSSSRRWRMGFLKSILAGTYNRQPPSGDGSILFFRMLTDDSEEMCLPVRFECGACGKGFGQSSDVVVGWKKNSEVFQISNASWLHPDCVDSACWHVITKVGSDGTLAFADDTQQHPLF